MLSASFVCKAALAATLSVSISGCSIRPLPEDFGTGITKSYALKDGEVITATTAIVRRIRCEARQAIATITMSYLRDELKIIRTEKEIYNDLLDGNGDPSFDQLIGKFYDISTDQFNEKLYNFASGAPREELERAFLKLGTFARSGVGYDFQFRITEDNNTSAGMLNFQFPSNSGKKELGLGGAYDRKRKNDRKFKIAETIEDIVTNPILIRMGCNEKKPEDEENPHFPIYGKINIIDSFSTYASLIIETGLTDDSNEFATNSALDQLASQDLTDVIEFTTTITGSAEPSITLNPVTNSAHLAFASIGLTNKREDFHKLTLILQPNGTASTLKKLELERLTNDNTNIIAFPANY